MGYHSKACNVHILNRHIGVYKSVYFSLSSVSKIKTMYKAKFKVSICLSVNSNRLNTRVQVNIALELNHT